MAYATLADVKAAGNYGSDTSQDTYLSDLLDAATELINARCHRSFARNPSANDGTFTFVVRYSGRRRLSAALGYHLDIQSVTTLELASYEGGSYTTIPASNTGYYLASNPDAPVAGWPYDDLILSAGDSTWSTFPTGDTTVRLTGVLGFLTVPTLVKRACVDMVREWHRQGPQGGVPSGVNQFGTPMFLMGEPHSFRQLTADDSPYVNRVFAV